MAYCRAGEDSDVYLVWTDHTIECMCCKLDETEPDVHYRFSELSEHLRMHKQYGNKVPEFVFETLEKEKEMYNNLISNKDKHWMGAFIPNPIKQVDSLLKKYSNQESTAQADEINPSDSDIDKPSRQDSQGEENL